MPRRQGVDILVDGKRAGRTRMSHTIESRPEGKDELGYVSPYRRRLQARIDAGTASANDKKQYLAITKKLRK